MPDRVDFKVPKGVLRYRTVACKSCGEPIVLWPHPTTKRHQPLHVATGIEDPENPVFGMRLESHFAYCSTPERFRRGAT